MKDTFDLTPESRTVDLPGGRFHYWAWGAERKELPCALLIHGITSSALSWVRVGPALADRYRVYAFDMRGHGDSIKPPAGVYSLRHTANDAQSFIDALHLERPLLIGHSWGGSTALVLASGAETERPVPAFSGVVLVDPAANFGRSDLERRTAFYTKDVGRSDDAYRQELYANNPGWSEADVEGKLDAMSKVSKEAVVSVFDQAGQMGNLLPLLSRVVAPTLLIRADAALGTTLDAQNWEAARGYLPEHSRAVEIAGATHNVHRNQFGAFMKVVNDFLSSENIA